MKQTLLALVAAALLVCTAPAFADTPGAPDTSKPTQTVALDSGDTAWMLVATGLVMLMVPGLALFYGGMVRRKNVLATMMHSMAALAIVGIQWLLFGYCLAFGDSRFGLIGFKFEYLALHGVAFDQLFLPNKIPIYIHCMYQGMFAIITPALISGALAERIKFGPYCLFVLLWSTLVYAPLAHWVWGADGWLLKLGALDFAGGTVVHVAAGLSGLAAILVLRKRYGYPQHAVQPNSMVLTLLGAGLLWFGWFGFNGGSALASNGLATSALAATQVAAASATLSWMIAEWLHRGKPTALGLASGLVAGLVAVTPASGFVTPVGALFIGLAAGGVCYGAVCLKPLLKYDDSLDAFGVHGVGGFLGALLTGVFATAALGNNPGGLLAGNFTLLATQLLAAVVAAAFAFGLTFVLVKGIDRAFGFCVDEATETIGLDRTQHGEVGFDLGPELAMAPEEAREPRAATVPPNGQKRFTVTVEGAHNGDLIEAWSNLCQAGNGAPAPEFLAVYPFVTTVQGNRFRFRGGDPKLMRENLQRLFQGRLHGATINAYVEQ